VALDERFRAQGIPLEADPARSPFRIYRDVRFSKDKSPYKTHVSTSFPGRKADGRGPHGFGESGNPGGYFHLEPGMVYVGGGMWHPPTAKLAAFRQAVATIRRGCTHSGRPRFVGTFGSIDGDKLTRVPQGFPKDHPEAELLKQKDLTFGRRLADDDAFSPTLPDLIADSLGRRSRSCAGSRGSKHGPGRTSPPRGGQAAGPVPLEKRRRVLERGTSA
jgi:uncharacterized protein (TIGR02453 family)